MQPSSPALFRLLACFLVLGCGKTVALGHGEPGPPGNAGSAGDAALGGASGSAGTGGGVGGDSGEPEAGAGGMTEPGPITITGKVVSDRGGHPVGGVTVEVQGQAVMSAEDGSFEAVATPPYDIVLRQITVPIDGVFLGVTRKDPTLYVNPAQLVKRARSTQSTFTLTRLLELGLDLPAGELIPWSVRGIGDAATVDELLAPGRDPHARSIQLAGSKPDDAGHSFSYEPD